MATENHDQLNQEDKRAPWERPALRRLGANYAEGGSGPLDDGNCVGGNANNHSFCFNST
jgi:hypothetical protein